MGEAARNYEPTEISMDAKIAYMERKKLQGQLKEAEDQGADTTLLLKQIKEKTELIAQTGTSEVELAELIEGDLDKAVQEGLEKK
jgi:hypothetical protein